MSVEMLNLLVELDETQEAAGAEVGQGVSRCWGKCKFIKNKKIIHEYVCFRLATMLTAKQSSLIFAFSSMDFPPPSP